MKKLSFYILLFVMGGLSPMLTSCSGYLDNMPKGVKVPTTLSDFEALLRDEYTAQRVDVTQALVLLNDRYVSPSSLSYYPLYKANYFWDETADRIALNNSDEGTYYDTYESISSCNLILSNVGTATDATESERNILTAQCKVLRAMNYFNLVNFYSDTYDASTASTKGGVPLITSAEVNAAYTQPSVQAIYDFILKDLSEAEPYLPTESATILHPNIGTEYAFSARVYLQMSNYSKALEYANKALACNDSLYDWTAYYAANKTLIENPTTYQTTASPMGYTYPENYNYRHGSSNNSSSENQLTVDRASLFETGDARFASRWKKRTVGSNTYYTSITSGFYNYGGMTTTEVYLIKAECLARTQKVSDAMDVLNKVRKTRILSAYYQPLTATDATDAVKKIRAVKNNEMILTIVPFADARRFNLDSNYASTLTKTVGGTTYTLKPDSYMWTMPFPAGAVKNSGNGTITQNVEK